MSGFAQTVFQVKFDSLIIMRLQFLIKILKVSATTPSISNASSRGEILAECAFKLSFIIPAMEHGSA